MTTVPPQAPQPVQSPLHLVSQLKSQNDGQQLEAALIANLSQIEAGLNAVNTVHFAHWFFLDNYNTVVLVTEYDGDFVTYVKDFIEAIGDLFNEMLSHVIDPPPLPVQQNPDSFVTWVQAHNVAAVGRLFSAYPSATVVNIKAAFP